MIMKLNDGLDNKILNSALSSRPQHRQYGHQLKRRAPVAQEVGGQGKGVIPCKHFLRTVQQLKNKAIAPGPVVLK